MLALSALVAGFSLHSAGTPALRTSVRASSIVVSAPEQSGVAFGRRTASTLGVTAAASTALGGLPLAASATYPGLSIMTTEGEMVFEMWDDVAPKHVDSFIKLAKQGFFDGGAFHRIIPGGAHVVRRVACMLAARWPY